jgi:hypothetical protein
MIQLLAAGLGSLVLGLNIMMVWRLLRVGGTPSQQLVNELIKGGGVVFAIGIIILVIGIIHHNLITPEGSTILLTGVSVTSLGFSLLLQGYASGNERIVYAGAWFASGIGIGLIIAYSITVYVFHLSANFP